MKKKSWDFPVSPVVRTLCFHWGRHWFHPRLGRKISHAAWQGQKEKEKRNFQTQLASWQILSAKRRGRNTSLLKFDEATIILILRPDKDITRKLEIHITHEHICKILNKIWATWIQWYNTIRAWLNVLQWVDEAMTVFYILTWWWMHKSIHVLQVTEMYTYTQTSQFYHMLISTVKF